ncbi:hypothetical protein D1007_22701 [Hordeum vulgare]|nr:hypothetical protein D1007_22701 [Hordeum vulgare]
MFDWKDRKVDNMEYKKVVEEEEFEKKKKKEPEEKSWKAMKEVEVDRDLLQKEKTKLDQVVSELLKDGYASKEKLE